MNPIDNSSHAFVVPYSLPQIDCHHAVSSAIKAYNDAKPVPSSRADLPDSIKTHLKNAGEAVFTEKSNHGAKPIAVASLVNLAAQGGPLGEEACAVLFNVGSDAYAARQSPGRDVLKGLDRIKTVGAEALSAFAKAQSNNPDEVKKMPVDLLHVAWQHATNTGDTKNVLFEKLEEELGHRLGSKDVLTQVQDQATALEEIKKVAGGIYGGTLEPGLGVVDLSGKPPADAERARWFKDLKEGRQRPVSFKTADNTFVHGFVHIDAKGNQHIVVVSNNPDKDFEASFAAALGLPKDSYTMEKLGVLSACKGMSEAGLAKWLFSYCAANGGGTKETLKKFQKHVQSLGNQGIVDFSEARRVRELHRELAKQPSTKAPQVHTDLNETLINEDLLLLDPTARDVIEKQTADPSEAIDPEVEPPTATSNLTGPFITEQLMKVSGTRRPVDVCKALEQPV